MIKISTLFLFFFSFISSIEEPIKLSTLFSRYDFESQYFRIPAIVRAKDGSYVTATDHRWYNNGDLPGKIDVDIRRSTDNCRTWSSPVMITPGKSDSKGYGDPGLVVDEKTGHIMCFFTGCNGIWASSPTDPQRLFYCISTDNGITWSDMVDFTRFVYGADCINPDRRKWNSIFLTSGRGHQTRDGRTMFVGVGRTIDESLRTWLIYTDDFGKSWNVSENSNVGDESKVMELNNGSYLMSIRNGGQRKYSLSENRGVTWSAYKTWPQVRDQNCNGEIFRYTSTLDGYDKNRLMHTIIYASSRVNLSILLSYDEGNTWPVSKVIDPGSSAYSSADVDPETGKIYVYYEQDNGNGYDMIVKELTLEWITDGADTFKPKSKANVLNNNRNKE